MHGGLSPDLNSMEQIRRVMRPTDVSQFWNPTLKSLYPILETDAYRFPTAVSSAIFFGPTQIRISLDGARTTEV
jgi:hypothetical protein